MTSKKPRAKRPSYYTIGVRFLQSDTLFVYTYRVRPSVKLTLGQEIVVPARKDNLLANAVAVVVEIHKTPQDTKPGVLYRYITGTIRAA